jgi:6,7-dimethyl-8-ribityllumazine synthase
VPWHHIRRAASPEPKKRAFGFYEISATSLSFYWVNSFLWSLGRLNKEDDEQRKTMFHAFDGKKAALDALSARELDGRGFRIGICHTSWNSEIVDALKKGVVETLTSAGVAEEDIVIFKVSGAYELPYAASRMISSEKVDAVIALGCLIKGETMHFEYICEAVTQGIMKLNLRNTGVPVIFGVLAVMNEKQGRVRAGLDEEGHNHGVSWAQTAIEMAALRAKTVSHHSCPLGFTKRGKCPMREKWFCHASVLSVITASIGLGMLLASKKK